MRRRIPLPGRRLLALLAGVALVGLAVPLVPGLHVAWYAAMVVVCLLAAVDLVLRPPRGAVAVERRFADVYHVGRESSYRLVARNASSRVVDFRIRESPPPKLEGPDVVRAATLAPGAELEIDVPFTPLARGVHELPPPAFRTALPIGLLEYHCRSAAGDRVAVSPGRPAHETEWLLSRVALLEEAAERVTRRRGVDSEFESLREYVVGDEPRRVDWRASARRYRPIVRQLQAERNTEMIVALDCGRLMGSLVGGIPKLDLAMTPLLDLAAVALRRKERLGFLAFDSGPLAFLPPRAGMKHLNTLLVTLAGLPVPTKPTSYLRAVRYLESRHRKRSLLVVFTDFTDEITAREMEASLAALTRRHIMLFIGVSDTHLEGIFDSRRDDTQSLFESAVAGQLLVERRRTLARMTQRGIASVDADPMRLSAPIIRKYLELRLGGAA